MSKTSEDFKVRVITSQIINRMRNAKFEGSKQLVTIQTEKAIQLYYLEKEKNKITVFFLEFSCILHFHSLSYSIIPVR